MSDLADLAFQAEKAYLVRMGLLSFPLLLHAENDHPDFIIKIVYPCFWSLHASWASCISLRASDALSNLYKSKLPSIRKELDAKNRNGPDPFDAWSNTHRGIDQLTKFAVEPFFSGSQTNSHFAEKFFSDALKRGSGFPASVGSRSSADPVQIRERLLSPIWSDETPQPIVDDWQKLRSQLVTRGDLGWLVDWYDDRVGGNPIDDDLELAKALVPIETWDNGPAVVNAQIARLIQQFESGETHKPEDAGIVEDEAPEHDGLASESEFAPPDPELAPVRLSVDYGVLRLHGNEAAPLADIAKDGWAVLSEEIDDLAAQLGDQNNDLLPRLMRARSALGDRFEDFSVIRFGLAMMTIEQFAREADRLGMLMPEQVAPLRSIVLQKNLLLRHAPEWANYVAALEPPVADANTEQDAANLAAEIAREIVEAHPEAIASDTAETLEELAAATDVEPTLDNPDSIASAEARRSWLRAFSEEMRAFAVDVVLEYRKLAVKGIAATAVTGSIAIVTSVSTKLLGLADKLPTNYGWLKDLVYFAASIVGV